MHNISVLIIDDNKSTIKLIAESLQHEFNFSFATTGKQGLVLAQNRPDVILLDIKLPDTSGFEIIHQLKQNPITRAIPVMFISSLTDVSDQELGFQKGAVDYIIKPIELPVLRMRIKTHARIYKQSEMLERLVATDPLTSLANRRRFDETLELELSRSSREKEPVALIMIDVDDFKRYNDNYGHGKGDDCLINVGKKLLSTVNRATDLVARIGGEEFAIILPNSNRIGAQKVADKIILEFQTAKIEHLYSTTQPHITVSMGVCCANGVDSMSKKQLLALADAELYKVKENGKNNYNICVVSE